jgi:hypothetical protein
MTTFLRFLLTAWLTRELRRRYPGLPAAVVAAERARRHRRTVPGCVCVGGCRGVGCALDAALAAAGGDR